MSIVYTAWPTVANVRDLITSANITLGAGVTDDQVQAKLDAAVDLLTHKTQRQFLPGSPGEVRYFDGSGTGSMWVDEFITITAISLFTIPSVTTVNLLNWITVSRQPFANTRIQIIQGPANMPYGWFTSFPQGRQNVGITGTWGYGATIPAAVWDGVRSKAAADIVEAARMSVRGILTDLHDLDVDYKFDSKRLGEGWVKAFDEACRTYHRPLRAYLQRNAPPLI